MRGCFRSHMIKLLYQKYERYITPIAFFAGFVWDNFTLRRVDLLYENIVLIWNLFLIALGITLINAYEARYIKGSIFEKIVRVAPIFMQFAFGGLFSAFFVFYSRSSSVLASWPFLLFLAGLFIGNEFFRKRYLRLTFQMSTFFIVLFSYSVFALPILVGKMGALIFIASGLAALAVLFIIAVAIFKIMPERFKQNLRALTLSIASIYILFNIFYFANIIPPIPLSLKESGIYHSIEKISEGNNIYKISFEPAQWYLFFKDASDTFHLVPGESIYSYSAVFAPTKLNITILHRWSYFDEEKGDWIEVSRLKFPMRGGRDGGYRGYTLKSNIKPGKWRVDVITERGQVLGRRTFEVVEAVTLPKLETTFR